mmetsp:Transcript_40893/g.102973  ORF Transcript_40893/g.102973 Transcript_40893/m.102973 type:complete len:310 (+) Transcript_40893:1103-2032(+)
MLHPLRTLAGRVHRPLQSELHARVRLAPAQLAVEVNLAAQMQSRRGRSLLVERLVLGAPVQCALRETIVQLDGQLQLAALVGRCELGLTAAQPQQEGARVGDAQTLVGRIGHQCHADDVRPRQRHHRRAVAVAIHRREQRQMGVRAAVGEQHTAQLALRGPAQVHNHLAGVFRHIGGREERCLGADERLQQANTVDEQRRGGSAEHPGEHAVREGLGRQRDGQRVRVGVDSQVAHLTNAGLHVDLFYGRLFGGRLVWYGDEHGLGRKRRRRGRSSGCIVRGIVGRERLQQEGHCFDIRVRRAWTIAVVL